MSEEAGTAGYDEALAADGRPRAAYAAFLRRCGVDPLAPSGAALAALEGAPFGDRLRIFPVPLVIPEREYGEVLAGGVRQRARALQDFFADMVLGAQRILSPDGPLPAREVRAVWDDEGLGLHELRRVWKGKTRAQIRFVYGPDLARLPDGDWVVSEDNAGRVGGMADAGPALARLLAATGATDAAPGAGSDDLEAAIRLFLDEAGVTPGGGGAAALGVREDAEAGPPWRENARKLEAAARAGLPAYGAGRLAEVRALFRAGRLRALVNFDVRTWKPKAELLDEVFGAAGVELFEGPGVKMVCSKGFLPFVEDMIRFYLKEEPILRTQPTRLMTDARLPDDWRNWVVKKAASDSSRDVHILRALSESRRGELAPVVKRWIEEERRAVVLQKVYSPSFLRRPGRPPRAFLIELRPIAYVYGDGKVRAWRNMPVWAAPERDGAPDDFTDEIFLAPAIREP